MQTFDDIHKPMGHHGRAEPSTHRDRQLPRLLTPVEIAGQTLANRVVMAPMTQARAGFERLPNATMAEYYAQRASAGLIISEATTISPQANGWNQSPGIYTDQMADAWRQVSKAVHDRKGVIFMQLWHCGRASHSSARVA